MRVITEEFKVYKFEELTEASKKKAIEDNRYINVDCCWWEDTYEVIKTHLGINITCFDIDRGSSVDFDFSYDSITNKFLTGLLEVYAKSEYLIQMTEEYLSEFDRMDKLDFSVDEIEDKLYQEAKEIQNSLENEILQTLRNEYEYLTSDEAIADSLTANEYEEFKENGEMY